MKPLHIAVLLPIAAILSACDPDYQDTGNLCAANETVAVRSTVSDFEINAFTDGYKPYFADIYKAMQLADGEVLEDETGTTDPLSAADKQAVIDEILSLINVYMGYTLNDGVIEASNNPLDFVEQLVATTDPGTQIDLFQTAKDQVANGIAANDGYCDFRNSNIVFDKTDRSEELSPTIYSMFFEPFRGSFQQDVIISQVSNPDDEDNRSVRTYAGINILEGSIFKADGFNEPDIRRESAIFDETQSFRLEIEDRYTNKLFDEFENDIDHIGIVEFKNFNTECDEVTDDDGEVTGYTCPTGAVIRPVANEVCEGGIDPTITNNTTVTIDETGKYQIHEFDLHASNPRLQGLKRFAIETDYDAQETRIYVSQYNSAIYDSDFTTIIEDFTSCERAAIQDEIQARVIDEAGDTFETLDMDALNAIPLPQYMKDQYVARLRDGHSDPIGAIEPPPVIPDPGYDVEDVPKRDEDGNLVFDSNGIIEIEETIEPTPIISFKGVALPERMTPES